MIGLYKSKYRIDSARLKNWDYGNSAAYFITICTANREHFFGEITNETMHLSPLGNIVEQEWEKSVALRPDMNLSLSEYVVMPNHFHAVIFIGENKYNNRRDAHRRGDMHGASTITGNKFGPQSKNLASVVRGFKSAVTTWARKNNIPFDWQPRFHDHIIRNDMEYNRIIHYITNNPAKWNDDKFF